MTTWSSPDHEIQLGVNVEKQRELIELSGNAFSVVIKRSNRNRIIKGMLIIAQLENNAKYQQSVSANLWINSKRAIIPLKEKMLITLINECDPMFVQGNEKETVRRLLPISFYGEVTHL
jgi:hypothetical protein